MKRTQEQVLDPTQDVALTTYLPFQKQPFTINGPYEAVMPIAEAVQAEDARKPVQRATVSTKVAQTAVEAVTLEGRRATIAAKLYDLANHSNMYDLLKQRRAEERDLAMARRLGLVSTVYCQKHERELAKVRGLGVE